MLKAHLPKGSITEFAQRQQFLSAMDPRLRRNVEPHIKDTDTWMDIVSLAERYDATMFKTGVYEQNNKPTDKPSSLRTKSRTVPSKHKQGKMKKTFKKLSKDEMERRKKEGACYLLKVPCV